MSTRYEVKLVTGRIVEVGGLPLLTEEDFKKRYPELNESMEKHHNMDNMTHLDMSNHGYLICKVFDPALSRDDFVIDLYIFKRILTIFRGMMLFDDEKKNLTSS